MGHEDIGTFLGGPGLNGARAKDTGVDTLGTTIVEGAKWNIPIGAVIGGIAGGVTGSGAAKGALKGGAKWGAALSAGDYISYHAGKKFAKDKKRHHKK